MSHIQVKIPKQGENALCKMEMAIQGENVPQKVEMPYPRWK